MSKPTIAEGTRDLSPQQVAKRNYIFDIIKNVFIKYGCQPLETPAMENLSTLMGKYGEEGDRLLFKILNNGNFMKDVQQQLLIEKNSNALVTALSKRGLRYDLTVPFARYVVMHQHEITFPFKRYQIQPVWRADRPQRGRYREFYQCDVDIVGSDALLYEAELVQIYDEAFAKMGLQVIIKMNNRKVLQGIAEVANIPDQMLDMTVAIDKLDKIGMDGVTKELEQRNIPAEAIKKIIEILSVNDISTLATHLTTETGKKGIAELQTVFDYLSDTKLHNQVALDVTLARGLNYYTGCIFEVVVDELKHPIKIGSIGGGGRYDDLTSVFGLKGVSGVGVSFGADRIYDVLEELQLFPIDVAATLQLLLIAFDEPTHRWAFQCLTKLRQENIACEIYPEPTKLKKQMKYANDRQVPFVVLIGEEELLANNFTLKNMTTGDQQQVTFEELIDRFGNI